MNKFNELIKSKREGLNLSLSAASSLLGMSKPHLWEMEQGSTKNPRASILNAIRKVYGIDAEKLLDSLDDSV